MVSRKLSKLWSTYMQAGSVCFRVNRTVHCGYKGQKHAADTEAIYKHIYSVVNKTECNCGMTQGNILLSHFLHIIAEHLVQIHDPTDVYHKDENGSPFP